MEKIKSISEAFSMQPITLEVKNEQGYKNYPDSLKHQCCKEIKVETMQVDSDKACDFYVGYNWEGKKIFEYLRSAMNVNYEGA